MAAIVVLEVLLALEPLEPLEPLVAVSRECLALVHRGSVRSLGLNQSAGSGEVRPYMESIWMGRLADQEGAHRSRTPSPPGRGCAPQSSSISSPRRMSSTCAMAWSVTTLGA